MIVVIVCIVCILFVSTATAQLSPSLAIRPFTDIRFGTTALNRVPGTINQFGTEGQGSSFETGVAIGIDILFPRLLAPALDGSFRLGADIAGGEFQSTPYAATIFDPQQEMSVPSVHQFTVQTSSMSAYTEGRLSYSVSNSFAAFAGPWMSYRFAASALQRETILSPQDVVFPTSGQRERIVATGESLLPTLLQYGIRMGIALVVPLQSSLSVQPEFALHINAGAWSEQGITHAVRPSFGCTFRFDTPHSPDLQLLDTATPLSISLSIAAIDSSGNRHDTAGIRTHSVLRRRYIALPPLVQIDLSKKLATSFELLRASEVDAYTTESLQQATEYDVYRHMLNILGSRLRANNSSTLTLITSTTTKEQHSHAEEIRRYLVDVWSVDSTRIAIRPASTTTPPSSSIILQPSSPALLAPIVLQLQEEYIEAPSIDIERNIHPDTGWTQWTVELQRNGHRIKTIDNRTAETDKHTFAFSLSDLFSDTMQSSITAQLIVVGSAGQTTSIADTLHITVQRIGTDADTVHIYTLFRPLPGLAIMNTINELLLDHLREFMDQNTTIVFAAFGEDIYGYASECSEQLLRKSGSRPATFSIVHEPAAGTILPFIRITARKTTSGR